MCVVLIENFASVRPWLFFADFVELPVATKERAMSVSFYVILMCTTMQLHRVSTLRPTEARGCSVLKFLRSTSVVFSYVRPSRPSSSVNWVACFSLFLFRRPSPVERIMNERNFGAALDLPCGLAFLYLVFISETSSVRGRFPGYVM